MSEIQGAERPVTTGGKQYHLHVGEGDLAPTVLLPGDPGRVPVLAAAWDTSEDVAYHREYRSMRGRYKGIPISACSTGIGGPSTEIALNELAAVGCNTFLRLGTTGGLQEHLRVGDIVISTASVRWDGASDSYAPLAFPAAASYEVVLALVEACERLGMIYHLGISASTASFYAGQSRPSFGDYVGVAHDRVERLHAMGVLNFEMESATVFTLSSLFGLRGGSACIIVADRFRNEFRPEGADEILGQLGAETSLALAELDALKERAGRKWYFPGLSSAGT